MTVGIRPIWPGFTLVVASRDSVRATIRAIGELDLAAKDSLRALLSEQREAGRVVVRLDISEVAFIDCSCLHVLVQEHLLFLAARGLLVLTGLGQEQTRLLKASGFDKELFALPGGPQISTLPPVVWPTTPDHQPAPAA